MTDSERVTPSVFKGLFYGNVLTADRCLRELLAVARGEMDAATAITALAL